MPLEKKSYQSYLLRCWKFPKIRQEISPTQCFVVETISSNPRHWRFNTFEELIDFLRVELLENGQVDEK